MRNLPGLILKLHQTFAKAQKAKIAYLRMEKVPEETCQIVGRLRRDVVEIDCVSDAVDD